MIRSRLLNSVLLAIGVILLALAVMYAVEAADAPYYGIVALFWCGVAVWCLRGAVKNLRNRKLAQRPYTTLEHVATWDAIGVLLCLTLFIVMATADIRFGHNIPFELLLFTGAAVAWLALLALPLMLWVAVVRRRRERRVVNEASSV